MEHLGRVLEQSQLLVEEREERYQQGLISVLKDALSKYARQLVKVQEVEAIDHESRHLCVFFVRHSAHAVDKAQGEELEEVELEGGGTSALSKVKDGEVLIVVVLEQVSDYAKEVEQVDLEEALVYTVAESLRLRLQ